MAQIRNMCHSNDILQPCPIRCYLGASRIGPEASCPTANTTGPPCSSVKELMLQYSRTDRAEGGARTRGCSSAARVSYGLNGVKIGRSYSFHGHNL